MMEPVTSLLQRELTILSNEFGKISRTIWELSRVLLRLREESATMALNKGESGDESVLESASQTPSGAAPPDPFQLDLWSSYD